jgi:hypothetical protein
MAGEAVKGKVGLAAHFDGAEDNLVLAPMLRCVWTSSPWAAG